MANDNTLTLGQCIRKNVASRSRYMIAFLLFTLVKLQATLFILGFPSTRISWAYHTKPCRGLKQLDIERKTSRAGFVNLKEKRLGELINGFIYLTESEARVFLEGHNCRMKGNRNKVAEF